ncbi:MAG: GNAT family N-acetyltransferase [Armatimonadetes bacterium]|nr:GNAT family N-acetyltransferase [Armatimonadota bacterium]
MIGSGGNARQDIRLEPLEAGDFPLIRPWIDPRVFRAFREPVDDGQLERLLTRWENDRPTSLGYRIVIAADSRTVGLVHAVIDWRNDLAHVQQIVVGDPALRNSGIGTASLLQLLAVCFGEIGLHRVQIFVDDDNAGAIACYKKAGFAPEGLMRDATKTPDGYVSWYSMSILEGEWRRERGRRAIR